MTEESNVHNLYLEANKLFWGRKVTMEPEVCIRDELSDTRYFNEVYVRLSSHERTKLNELLEKFIAVGNSLREGKIRFTIDSISELKDEEGQLEFLIHFHDSLDGSTLFFVPTYGSVVKQVGKKHALCQDSCWKGDNPTVKMRVKDSRVVRNWDKYGDLPAKIGLYVPEAYMDNKGILMYAIYKEGTEQNMKKFKKVLVEEFIPSSRSPIACDIRGLFNKGIRLLEEEKKEEDVKVLTERMFSLKGREF